MARKQSKSDVFTRFSTAVSEALGRPWVFVLALALLVAWALSGPVVGFGDTWQLVINTGTTIVTFLMVFIIQNTQNRDNLAFNLKLDALLKKQGLTRDDLLHAEEESDKQLEQQKEQESTVTKSSKGKKSKRRG